MTRPAMRPGSRALGEQSEASLSAVRIPEEQRIPRRVGEANRSRRQQQP